MVHEEHCAETRKVVIVSFDWQFSAGHVSKTLQMNSELSVIIKQAHYRDFAASFQLIMAELQNLRERNYTKCDEYST